MKQFSDDAHALDLAIAQKNSAELVGRRTELGTDFAVAEECNQFTECDTYTSGYGDHVIVIEYRRQDFTAFAAARMASTSACAVGSWSRTVRFPARAMISPSRTTMAPMGTSPPSRAARASARLIWGKPPMAKRFSLPCRRYFHRQSLPPQRHF